MEFKDTSSLKKSIKVCLNPMTNYILSYLKLGECQMNNCIMQRVRHVDYDNGTALVLNRENKAYSVKMSDKVMHDGIKEKDLAFIKIINGVWIIVDFESHDLKLSSEQYSDAELMGEY